MGRPLANAAPIAAPKLKPMPPMPMASRHRPREGAGRKCITAQPVLPASVITLASSGIDRGDLLDHLAAGDQVALGALVRKVLQAGMRRARDRRTAEPIGGHAQVGAQFAVDQQRGRPAVDVGRVAVEADDGLAAQAVLQSAARRLREPRADQDARGGAVQCPPYARVAARPHEPDEARVAVVEDVPGVGLDRHPRAGRPGERRQLRTGVGAGHSAAGDDQHRLAAERGERVVGPAGGRAAGEGPARCTGWSSWPAGRPWAAAGRPGRGARRARRLRHGPPGPRRIPDPRPARRTGRWGEQRAGVHGPAQAALVLERAAPLQRRGRLPDERAMTGT